MPAENRCHAVAAGFGGRQLHEVWQAHFGGDVDEALLELNLLEAAAEGQKRNVDPRKRSSHTVAVGEVAHHHLNR